jgi:hypothetical protein
MTYSLFCSDSNFRSKYLFSQLFCSQVSANAPTSAPSKDWLAPDVVGHQLHTDRTFRSIT